MYSEFSGGSLAVAINAVQKNAAAEGMNLKDYIWCGHDPTAVAVMTEASDWSICKVGTHWNPTVIPMQLEPPCLLFLLA